ncbi:MAG: UbiA family prenyltransferase [Dehalococcoidia bacterium]
MSSQNVWVAVWRSMRPGQWQKNLIAYAPLLFSAGTAWDPGDSTEVVRLLALSSLAFALLCLVASGGYLLNDARDAEADRAHPVKRHRPVAAGLLPVDGAVAAGCGLIFGALAAATFVSTPLFAALGAYAAVTLAYSLLLRRVAGLDVVAIAAGFVLRTVAGAEAIEVRVSWWLLACTALGAAYVVLVKRAQEQALLRDTAREHRPALATYGAGRARRASWAVAVATVTAYAGYAWTAEHLPDNHAMFLTVPLVAFGLVRYGVVAMRSPERNADELMVRDRWLLLTVIAFAVTAFAVLAISSEI